MAPEIVGFDLVQMPVLPRRILVVSTTSIDSEKVSVTRTFLSTARSGVIAIELTVGAEVSTLRFKTADALDWKVELFWAAVTDQLPSARVGNVQDAELDVTWDSVRVQVLVKAVGVERVAVTVRAAPAVKPVRSNVGVLSEVSLSAEAVPVSDAVCKFG